VSWPSRKNVAGPNDGLISLANGSASPRLDEAWAKIVPTLAAAEWFPLGAR